MTHSLILLILCLSGASAATNNSDYSVLTKEDLSVLPRAERTPAAALRLCMERSSSQFCAWLHVDPSTELVSGGTCFDEMQAPCNRFGRTGGKNSRKYRFFTCNGCSQCQSQRELCTGVNCTLMCYCSCGHYFPAEGSRPIYSSSSVSSDWHFVYPCSGICDTKTNCPYGEDEHNHFCSGLVKADNDLNIHWWTVFKQSVLFKVMVILGIIALAMIVFLCLNEKYAWVVWLMRRPKPPPAMAVQQQAAHS